ncbi:MAG: hypothetical protein LLG00_03475 [Planctomycetaceae bacterium]|nr:hypothetical protein [Planctomycetaceae bacterium]
MDVVTDNVDAGLRKAAVLVSSLDACAAETLLSQLGPDQAESVRRAAAAISDIDANERQRVIDDFCRIGTMLPKAAAPGIELTEMKPRPLFSAGRDDGDRDAPSSPFEFLRDTEDSSLAQLLADERPGTIALVLSHLPAEQGGDVLARLTPALQIEVVRRLSDLQDVDPETVREVERALECRLSQQVDAGERRAAGPESAAKILAACDGETRGRILDNLATADESLAERLGRRAMSFDDLAQCDDRTLRAVVAAAGPDVVQAALLGAPPAVLSRLLGCLPSKEAKCLRRKLAHPEPIRLSEVEDARQRMAALASGCRLGEPAPNGRAAA